MNAIESQRLTVESVASYDEATDASLVKVKIEYPKDYAGYKGYENGQFAYMSAESAEQLEKAGIGTIAKDKKEEAKQAESNKSNANEATLDAERVTGTNTVKVAEPESSKASKKA